MKLLIKLLLVFVIVSIFLGLYQNNLNNALKNAASSEGKPPKFKVSYAGFIPLGEAVLTNNGRVKIDGKELVHLNAQIRPNRLIEMLYKVRVEVDSFIDKDSFLPSKFAQSLTIPGKEAENKSVFYDQQSHVMEAGKEKRVILADTHDILSALFYLINQDFTVGKKFDININTNQKNYRLLGSVLEKRQVNAGGKVCEIYQVKGSVKRRDKSLRNSSQFDVWILNKPFKTAVFAKVFTKAGPLTISYAK